MKSHYLYIAILFFGSLIILNGCYYDEVAPLDQLPENVSFKNDVAPILVTNCGSSGCHDATPSHEPALVGGEVYTTLLLDGYVKPLDPQNSSLLILIESGSMPPSGPISSANQKIIEAWIAEGAEDN